MIDLFDAAWEVHIFLTTHQVLYVFIGGLAVQYWGEPRFTHDLDLTVAVPVEEADDFVHLVTDHFLPRQRPNGLRQKNAHGFGHDQQRLSGGYLYEPPRLRRSCHGRGR